MVWTLDVSNRRLSYPWVVEAAWIPKEGAFRKTPVTTKAKSRARQQILSMYVLVGGGKVGTALARQLSEEGHNVTVIDTNKARVEHIGESYDVMSILGNGSSITTLSEAGVEEADVFIAVTGSDELNLLCCMFAKKAGHCHAIARVRNPSYSHELDFIKKHVKSSIALSRLIL